MSVPGTVLYFTAYESFRDALGTHSERSRDVAPLIAGGGARVLTATVVSPIELMRTRMQAEHALTREGMVGGASALVAREGWGAIWRGLAATLWRDVPFSCICARHATPPPPPPLSHHLHHRRTDPTRARARARAQACVGSARGSMRHQQATRAHALCSS